MGAAGRLAVRVLTEGGLRIRSVDIRSSRPPVSTLLSHRRPEEALELAGLLFQVCRRAQAAAAGFALAAAGFRPLRDASVRHEHLVACELLQEHLWRLLLDWPPVFGLDAGQALFRRAYAALQAAQESGGLPAGLLATLERDWLGMPAVAWLALDDMLELRTWSTATASPAAALCARVAQADVPGQPAPPVPLLQDQGAGALRAGWGAAIDQQFAARPHRAGETCETGVLCWHAGAPLVADALRGRPGRLLARLLARIRDTLTVLLGQAGARVDASGDGEGDGLALVHTARGLLVHRVRLAGGQVAGWTVVAPTEWNFHPAGPLARGLPGLRFSERQQCERWVHAQLLSLDPCVDYRIEFQHA